MNHNLTNAKVACHSQIVEDDWVENALDTEVQDVLTKLADLEEQESEVRG